MTAFEGVVPIVRLIIGIVSVLAFGIGTALAAIGLTGLSIDGGVLFWSIPLFVWIIVAALFGAVFMSPARPMRASRGGRS